MKLPVKNVSRLLRIVGLKLKDASPEIMTISGIIVGGACVVTACKATLKAQPKVVEAKERISELEKKDENKTQTAEEQKKQKAEIVKVKVDTAIDICKVYAVPAACGVLSIALTWTGNRVLRKRLVASTAAYVALAKSYNEYRKRLIADLGVEKDREYMYGQKVEKVTSVDAETGEVTEKTVVKKVGEPISPYARMFVEGIWDNEAMCWTWKNPNWKQNAYLNKIFLKSVEREANERLERDGFLFLNDVYRMLGFPLTYEGQMVGWLAKDSGGADGYVDFGIFDSKHMIPGNDAFLNEVNCDAFLDFNVDGEIISDLALFYGPEYTQKLCAYRM